MTPGTGQVRYRSPGAYILLFRLPQEVEVEVGRLGTFSFRPGSYAYVGSARGGLEARAGRHLRGGERKFWHIDHLIDHAVACRALLFRSSEDIECELAAMVAGTPGASVPVPGFGSSDCRCRSHLFYLDDAALRRVEERARERRAVVLR